MSFAIHKKSKKFASPATSVFGSFHTLEPNFGSPTRSPPLSLTEHPFFFPLPFPHGDNQQQQAAASSSSSSSSSSPHSAAATPAPPAFNPSPASPLLSLTGTSQPPFSLTHTVKSSSSTAAGLVCNTAPPSPLQHHVLVLGRCLQLCSQQAAADAAQLCLRQLRGDGEMGCLARCVRSVRCTWLVTLFPSRLLRFA